MIHLREGNIEHRFADTWTASKYDEWPFYRVHFEKAFGGNKAVDIVALDGGTLWLIELKDYRGNRRTKTIDLAQEVAVKVRDSIAGLVAASKWHGAHAHLQESQKLLGAKKIRILLHLEQPPRHSKLFPREFDLSKVQQRLKQLVKVIDAHPLVIDIETSSRLPWSVRSISGDMA